MSEIVFTPEELEAATVEANPATMTDSEKLDAIYGFMSNINSMLVEVAPALESLSRSPMGKMLGLK